MSPRPGYHHKKRRISHEVCQQSRLAYEAGESLADIAARLGLSTTAIKNRIRIAGGVIRSIKVAVKLAADNGKMHGSRRSGADHYNWNGGRRISDKGYVCVMAKWHGKGGRDGYMHEHVLIAEKFMGRTLHKNEVVHHINGVKTDNRPENLQVMTRAAHASHHHAGSKRKLA